MKILRKIEIGQDADKDKLSTNSDIDDVAKFLLE